MLMVMAMGKAMVDLRSTASRYGFGHRGAVRFTVSYSQVQFRCALVCESGAVMCGVLQR